MKGQGLPVNMIVLVALALLVLVVVGAFFITGMSGAGSSFQTVNQSQAQCQNLCNSIITAGISYDSCTDLRDITPSVTYRGGPQGTTDATACSGQWGPCNSRTKDGGLCPIGTAAQEAP